MRKTAKERYQEYKRNGDGSFAEWLGIRKPEIQMSFEYPCNGLYRMTNWVGCGAFRKRFISGEYCKTKKEAKESYKLALAIHRMEMRNLYG